MARSTPLSLPAPAPRLPVERTFVLKLAEGSQPGELAGRLEHVLSGRQLDFRNARQLMAALREAEASTGSVS